MTKYIIIFSITTCIVLSGVIAYQKKENNILVKNNATLQVSNTAFATSLARIQENIKLNDDALLAVSATIKQLREKQDNINTNLREMIKNENCKNMYNTSICTEYIELWNNSNSN